jgi:hypothetical protein
MAPLHLAARGAHAAVVGCLLARGAKPDAASKERHTPLHEAATAAEPGVAKGMVVAVAELLLAAGAAVGALNVFGVSPLHKASEPWP